MPQSPVLHSVNPGLNEV